MYIYAASTSCHIRRHGVVALGSLIRRYLLQMFSPVHIDLTAR